MDKFDAGLFNKPDTSQFSDEILDDMMVMDSVIYSCFTSRAGKKALTHLKDVANQSGFDASLGLLNGIAQGFSREGQLALIAYIEGRMARAEKGVYK